MMDGFVTEIRQGLDDAGYQNVPIMSYGIKYAYLLLSHFQVLSMPLNGWQDPFDMFYDRRKKALNQQRLCDMMIVKPALSYLDIVRDVKNHTNVPVVAYNVSGEYSMTKAAALNGWIDEENICTGTFH
jgi:porphobilinogen synthase